MHPSLTKSIQLIIDPVVSSVNAYNTGLAHCETSSDGVYAVTFAFVFVAVFLISSSGKKFSECWLRLSTESVVLALVVVWLFQCYYIRSDTPSNIYSVPVAAARYGCLYHSKPISLAPLFNDKQVLAQVAEQFKYDWQDEFVIRKTIALLRTLSVENYYANNCTCVC